MGIESLPELRAGTTAHNDSVLFNEQSISESVARGLTKNSAEGCADLQNYDENRGSTTSDDGQSEISKKRRVLNDEPKKKKPKNAGKIGSKYNCGKCGKPRKVEKLGPNGESLGEIPHKCEFISVHGEQNEARVLTAFFVGIQLGLKLS